MAWDECATAPSDYLPSIARKQPGALEAQSIPMDPALWTLDQFPRSWPRGGNCWPTA